MIPLPHEYPFPLHHVSQGEYSGSSKGEYSGG